MAIGMNTNEVSSKNFFAVRYFWTDPAGVEHSHGSVAGGATPDEALKAFQAANRHVRVELVEAACDDSRPIINQQPSTNL